METTEAITITLLCVGTLALFLLLIAVWRVGGSVLRVERLLKEGTAQPHGEPQSVLDPATPAQRKPLPNREGAFAEFLAAEPDALKMTKREQAEAFRKWRKDRGLSWSGS